jgi:hypothetical protein
MAITRAVYDPPLSSLPYLVAVFHPDGTVEVVPFKTARAADAHAAQEAPPPRATHQHERETAAEAACHPDQAETLGDGRRCSRSDVV